MLQVKNVKSFIGMEGHGFNCSLYLDGKKVAFVIDDANGGEFHYQWEGKTPQDRTRNEKEVMAVIDALPPEIIEEDAEPWKKSLYPEGFRKIKIDVYVGRLVDDYENNKKLERQKKTSVPFKTAECKPGTYYVLKHGGKVEETKSRILKRYPGAEFL